VQVPIGREQLLHVVESAAAALREAGVGRPNIDLMYGLPYQTVDSVQATCAKVLALNPERVACYGYAHMPQRKANQRLIDETALSGRDERFRQSQAVAEAFAEGGYVAIGLDHFSRPDDPFAEASRNGRLHRNFQGYTDDDRSTLVALGASAISQVPGGYVQNVADIGTYLRHTAEGRLASARGYRFEADDKSRAAIIEALMCNFSVNLGTVAGPHDHAGEIARLHPLVSDGIVTLEDRTIAVMREGRPFVRLAAAVFDRFRAQDVARFSPAV
jgi:oxygen-independent coproporphyrinogen-3 oxidase